MYKSFFGLKSKPFRLNPHLRFLFNSEAIQRAVNTLKYGLYQREGLVLLTGAPGCGKTMLVQNVSRRLPDAGIQVFTIATPRANGHSLLLQIFAALGLDVLDTGNLSGPVNPRGPRDPQAAGLRNLPEAIFWTQAVHDAVWAQFQAGRMPIMLGGDHHLAAGSISAVARHARAQGKKLRVLWLDAHSDINTPDTSPSGNIHGIPVANLLGFGPHELISMSGETPAIKPENMRYVGIRSVDEHEKRMIRQMGIQAFDMRAIDELGMREAMHRVLDGLDDDTHLHVSFDADFLDPEIAPGTGTRVRGGATYREAQLCMEMIADTGRMASLDVVEVNPALDIRNQTAELVVDLVESLFGKSTLINR